MSPILTGSRSLKPLLIVKGATSGAEVYTSFHRPGSRS